MRQQILDYFHSLIKRRGRIELEISKVFRRFSDSKHVDEVEMAEKLNQSINTATDRLIKEIFCDPSLTISVKFEVELIILAAENLVQIESLFLTGIYVNNINVIN